MTTADQASAPTDAEIASACRWLGERYPAKGAAKSSSALAALLYAQHFGEFATLAECIVSTAHALGWHPPQSAPVAERMYTRTECLAFGERVWWAAWRTTTTPSGRRVARARSRGRVRTARVVLAERRRMRRAGTLGVATRVHSHHVDGRAHHLRVVDYALDPHDYPTPHVELWESHDRGRRARIVPLCLLVHLIQNIGADELASIAARRRPGVAS